MSLPLIYQNPVHRPSEKPSETVNFFSESKSTENVLLDAGYTISQVKDIMASKRKNEESQHVIYDENRPQTQVFSQGKVYTYEKLDIKTNNIESKPKPR